MRKIDKVINYLSPIPLMEKNNLITITSEYVDLVHTSNLKYSTSLLSLARTLHLYYLQGQKKKAEEILSEVLEKITRVKNPEALSKLYFEIGLFYRRTDKEKMKKYFEQAISFSKKLDKESRTSLLDEYATRLADLGEQDAALLIALKIPIEKIRLLVLYDLWSHGIKTPETEKARDALITEFLKSEDPVIKYSALLQTTPEKISISEILSTSPEDSSQILVSMASKLINEGKKDEAISLLDKALETIKKCDDSLFKSQILLEIAELRMSANLVSDEIISETIETVSSHTPTIKALTLLKAAEIYRNSGKVLRANRKLRQAIKISKKERDPYYRFLIMEQIANYLICGGFSEELQKTLQKMLQTLKMIKDPDKLEDAVLRFSELFLNLEYFYKTHS